MDKLASHLREETTGVFYAATQAIRRHASGSTVLIIATVAALVVANIPQFNHLYFEFWEQEVRLQLGSFNLFSHSGHPMSLIAFINDALMAVFFFSIGLEIKREILVGELSSFRQALLPIIGACGGMIVPVVIFTCFGRGTDYAQGAAIPMATDIAFSLGILSILGSRVPIALKVFLTTLAVVDDIGGIIVIATCYSTGIEYVPLLVAVGVLAILVLGQFMRIQSKIFYLTLGGVVWFLFLNSGLHPTIAGVLVAFCVPAKPVFNPKKYIQLIRDSISHFRAEDDETLNRRSILSHQQMDWLKQVEHASDKVISPLQELEDSLHPIVNYLQRKYVHKKFFIGICEAAKALWEKKLSRRPKGGKVPFPLPENKKRRGGNAPALYYVKPPQFSIGRCHLFRDFADFLFPTCYLEKNSI